VKHPISQILRISAHICPPPLGRGSMARICQDLNRKRSKIEKKTSLSSLQGAGGAAARPGRSRQKVKG
jgi:hypothetical protein